MKPQGIKYLLSVFQFKRATFVGGGGTDNIADDSADNLIADYFLQEVKTNESDDQQQEAHVILWKRNVFNCRQGIWNK